MSIRRRFIFLAILVCAAAAARAQEPQPARLRAASFDDGGSVELTLRWRFHAGDDPSWSAAGLDDRGWQTVLPLMPAGERPSWTGVGWFRRHLVLDPSLLGTPVVLRVAGPGRADVFVDGRPLMTTAEGGTAGERGQWITTKFSSSADHVIAVRYEADAARAGAFLGFRFSLERAGAEAQRTAGLRRTATLYGVFVAIPAVLAVLHLGLFTFYPRLRENLFCALCLLSFAVIVGAELARNVDDPGPVARMFATLSFGAVLAAIFFGLCTYCAIRCVRMPRSWMLFAAAAVLMLPVGALAGNRAQNVCWSLYFVASIAEIVRVEMRGGKRQHASAFPLLIGMLVLDAAIALQILISFGLVSPPFGFSEVYLFGILAFSIATSLFIARSFAQTSVDLERRLAEIDTLNVQMIATERESARKGAEIDAARTLQRSILPASLPQLPRLEIAARITTASEVGGDYYDFRLPGDGSLLVAVGDASGHGVAAGAMVIATKALFSSLAGEERLPEILAQCDRVLRGMNVRPLFMCLQLARVSLDRVTVASAAMPRPLLVRRGSGHAEEIPASGVPLASGLPGPWTEVSVPLASGDTLLFASDGLAEALSPSGEPLGYERVARSFAEEARGGDADRIAARLMDEAQRWRSSGEQNDDVAVVVVRVR